MIEETIFHAALEKPSEERAAFLEQACATDAALRRRVDILLRAHANPGCFMRQPAVNAPTPDSWPARILNEMNAPAEQPGTVIGPYKLLEQIGEGGMGLVFMAEQSQPMRRKVALKVLKPGMDTRQVVARFDAERQAVALMNHPNIAQVFDAGATPTGRPYFVMELVRGVPITEFCDQRRLTTRQRLELFVTVCHAVQHAHQKGIIHRDLKPSNILVTLHDTLAVPKVIDFGIAKATTQPLTERSLFTHFSQMIGTPLYMSPEQAEMNGLDVDTRSDVYALGVLLYELLTGTTPFESERLKQVGFDEMRRVIREEEPPRPSQRVSTLQAAEQSTLSEQRGTDVRSFASTLRGELDWIVIKAMEKDRNRRYESASAFAADVQRYLADEAIEACPPSRAYRFRKFARKNRRLLAMAATIAVVLLAATGVSAWQAAVARSAQYQAEADRDRAAKAERQAAAISEFLQKDLLQQVSPDHLKRDNVLSNDPNLTVLEALHRAAAKIGNRFQDQPLVEAAIRNTIGHSYRALGDERRASDHFERSAELLKVHLGPDHPDTLKTQLFLAFTFCGTGHRSEGIALLEYVAERQRAALGVDDKATQFTMNSLGETYRNAGWLDKAAGMIEPILEKRKAMYGLGYEPTINSMRDLGCVYRDMGRYEDAIPLLELASKRLDAIIGADHVNTLLCIQDLARAYEGAGRFEDADRQFRDIIVRIGNEKLRQTGGAYNSRILLTTQCSKGKGSPRPNPSYGNARRISSERSRSRRTASPR
jgi:serine/threonine protein kinase